MTTNQKNKSMRETVLSEIRSGSISMRPRLFFLLKTGLIAFLSLLVVVLTVFIASFIIFTVRVNGNESLLLFGVRGLTPFLLLLPWTFIAADIVLVVVLSWLLRTFKYGYRSPLLFLFIVVFIVLGTIGFSFDVQTNFHHDRFEESERGERTGFVGEFYESAYEHSTEEVGVFRGYVTQADSESFVLGYDDYDDSEDDGQWIVHYPDDFRGEVHAGDFVYVAGEREGGYINAFGVRVLKR